MNKIISDFLPALIGVLVGGILYFSVGWWGFLLIFPYIGGCVTLGILVGNRFKGAKKDIGRRIAILAISPIFLVFLGLLQRENLQIEETVFYGAFFLSSGIFTRVLIHYAVAKIGGPFIWGRGFCGWACWTAALLEWLPINDNKTIPPKYTWLRYPVLVVSILIPLLFLWSGYDYVGRQIDPARGKEGQLIWFMVGNGIYYLTAVILAFSFRKKRAFCKILCPVSLVMKPSCSYARIKKKPTENECIKCKKCNELCPMDVDVMGAISNGLSVNSTECILCGQCSNVCPVGAIK
ncbi:4Fe-4S binding domain-containing protein [Maridesulfovibrio ferrireducens]|uniref:4Fe-4S binding domain-containing protein n=1 Tax=Maridesulfovibrio ferrireducens TaxID=246191 RepID=A0A1G9CYV9_9BACT|nr:4Fe-4S binding protein [Maridesulfovibrio ferrireducens]SDK56830.1 4Fe-4S binding domain-containing protein [Maridesulfovibrio ferrireducens]